MPDLVFALMIFELWSSNNRAQIHDTVHIGADALH